MITEALYAWVLHKRWSGDTSAQVTFFTREHGMLGALCNGGRTPKKQSLLQAFTPLSLTFDVRGDWHYVRQLDAIAPSLILTGDNLFAGLYVNEILYHALQQLDACPILYDFYVQTLHGLTAATQRPAIEVVLRRFEWQLLTWCGYQMSLTQEALTAAPIMPEKHYSFNAEEGFVLAGEGIPGACILALAQDELDDPVVLKTAKWIMRRAIDHALDGKRIRARELYKGRVV